MEIIKAVARDGEATLGKREYLLSTTEGGRYLLRV